MSCVEGVRRVRVRRARALCPYVVRVRCARALCACVGHLILLSTFLGYLFNKQMITN